MYRRFPGTDSFSAVGDEGTTVFLPTNTYDTRDRCSLDITVGQQEQRNCEQTTEPENSADGTRSGVTGEYLTSPPLSSFSVLLKDGEEAGEDLEFGSLRKGTVLQSRSESDVRSAGLEPAMTNLAMQDAMELVSFKLGQRNVSYMPTMPSESAAMGDIQCGKEVAAPKLSSVECQSVSSSEDDDAMPFSGPPMTNSAWTGFGQHQASTPVENDRGFRKKSREKMRRHEVNDKFEMLVNVLGLAGRVRKRNILHEAAVTIKGLRRECNQLRHDRDRLQQEFNHLAAYLQNSECGPPFLAQ
ncbi:hypothetical protein PHYPSEUDO_003208 [Phytophthora pseudosyringae]|uniref:BHLH domain-containing protein n=1 Tax=Phytophthora pseudosyringae TaxID=221518 RepID=A0A8T1VRD5_9STRA|nr:hypothetical protein PHYPSEUDO_003208 [Phytophthora pseudosyringae]